MTPEELQLAMLSWKESQITNIVRFAIITVILFLFLAAILLIVAIMSIADDWPRYRCKPYVMPFAATFGHDSAENYKHCMKETYAEQSGQTFAPIYEILGQFTGTVGVMTDTANGMRQLLGNFMNTTRDFVGNVKAKIEALLFQLRITFLRMQTLMNRVYGTMYSIIWMGTSSIMTGQNLADNDLVSFLFEFCFHPETRVALPGGQTVAIKDLKVGDYIVGADGEAKQVTSTFRFSGTRTPMVQIGVDVGADIMSAAHFVQMPNGSWGPAAQHPEAQTYPSIPELVCLNVEGHAFRTAAGLVVADYDESEAPDTVTAAQRIAEACLNGGGSSHNQHSADAPNNYALGVSASAEVQMSDGSWKAFRDLQLGDRLHGTLEVLGLVTESAQMTYKVAGIPMTPAQLVWQPTASQWVRASTIGYMETSLDTQHFKQVITDRVGPLHIRAGPTGPVVWIRDYREAPVPEMESPYIKDITRSKNRE